MWQSLLICVILLYSSCPAIAETGYASYYTVKSSSNITANGERYDENKLTCALRSHNFGRSIKVCNIENGKCVIVRHNDFGPNIKHKDRIIDLTPIAFKKIGNINNGLIKVKIQELKRKVNAK